MRLPVTLGLAVALAIASALWASAADPPEQQVRGLIPKIVRAWESMNTGTVDPYYAKDADLTFFDIAPRLRELGRISSRRAEDVLRTQPEPEVHDER